MSYIIQNAIYLIEEKRFVVSQHRHDFSSFKIRGEDHHIDGGKDYFKASVIPDKYKEEWIDYNIMSNHSLDYIEKRLLWGHKNIRLSKDLSDEELRDIINTTWKGYLGHLYEHIAQKEMERRK